MRLIARMRRDDAARPPIYFEERETDVPPLDGAGAAAAGDHARRAAARPAATARSGSASGTSARRRAFAPDAQGFDEYPRLLRRRLDVPRRGRSRRRELDAGLRPDRPLPVGEPAVRGAQGRRAALRAERLHDRLPRRRGGARDRREPQPPVLPVPRVQRAAHAAPGAASPTTTRSPGIENHRCASTPR